MMKRIAALVLTAAMIAAVSGCSAKTTETKDTSGWRTIEGVEGISQEGELYNFYFKNGKPYHAESGLQLFTVESKKYAFNTKGEMQTGLKVVNLEGGEVANFYFAEDGVMRTVKESLYIPARWHGKT